MEQVVFGHAGELLNRQDTQGFSRVCVLGGKQEEVFTAVVGIVKKCLHVGPVKDHADHVKGEECLV